MLEGRQWFPPGVRPPKIFLVLKDPFPLQADPIKDDIYEYIIKLINVNGSDLFMNSLEMSINCLFIKCSQLSINYSRLFSYSSTAQNYPLIIQNYSSAARECALVCFFQNYTLSVWSHNAPRMMASDDGLGSLYRMELEPERIQLLRQHLVSGETDRRKDRLDRKTRNVTLPPYPRPILHLFPSINSQPKDQWCQMIHTRVHYVLDEINSCKMKIYN